MCFKFLLCYGFRFNRRNINILFGNFIMPLILNCIVSSFVIILLWDTLFLDFMLLFMSLKSMLIRAFQTHIWCQWGSWIINRIMLIYLMSYYSSSSMEYHIKYYQERYHYSRECYIKYYQEIYHSFVSNQHCIIECNTLVKNIYFDLGYLSN